jgi:prenyl protein peptidase
MERLDYSVVCQRDTGWLDRISKLCCCKMMSQLFSPDDISSLIPHTIQKLKTTQGPLTEELLFRSAITPLLILSPISESPSRIILLDPLPFGLAHIHHFYEFTLTNPHTALVPALLRSLFQFGFTTVFGWFATFVFLRTGNVWVCILIHSFCNWMGLPRVWGRLESGVIGPAGIGGGSGGSGQDEVEEELAWPWTAVYYVLLMGGAVGFWKALWMLTDVGDRQALIGFG